MYQIRQIQARAECNAFVYALHQEIIPAMWCWSDSYSMLLIIFTAILFGLLWTIFPNYIIKLYFEH
jgi:ascorbate-specific PTS system EIIC-type component UlaA